MNHLAVNNLSVSYGRHQVLRDVTIEPLESGTVTGLLGPNASGKSTLVKTLAGINHASTGSFEVVAGGEEVTGHDLRDAIGYVPQDLLSSATLTAFESVLVSSKRSSRLRVGNESLEAVGRVMEFLDISHLANRYVSELSGGQRQLVAVAQMLVRNPEILLLDEPTSALDLRHQVELLKTLRTEVSRRGSVALVAIHDLNLASRYCDQLVVLLDGEILAQGKPADVISSELLERVYGFRARVLYDEGVPVVSPVAVSPVAMPAVATM